MMTFVIDLWQDLREKRLWPVAVGLLAAIVAGPLILLKPASQPNATPLPVTNAPSGVQLPVVSVGSGPVEGSKLQTFSERNPFKPLDQLAAASASQSRGGSSSASGGASPLGAAATAAGAKAAGAGAGAAPAGIAGIAAKLGSPSSGSSPSASGPSSSSPSPAGTKTGTTPQGYYQYTVNVRFGAPGHEKTVKNLKTLTMLPNPKQPVVVFMGVSLGTQKAIFFIPDPNFDAAGKGTCNATGAACRFVSLSTKGGSSETFSAQKGGAVYNLNLVSIGTQQLKTLTPKVSDTAPGSDSASSNDALTTELLTLSNFGATPR